MIEIVGWLATVCQLFGVYLNAKKIISCWYVWFLSNILWVVYSVASNLWPVFAINIAFIGFNIYGYVCWKKNKG